MNNQEIFNKVWDHFIKNKGKASCDVHPEQKHIYRIWYRNRDATASCAIGILIPEDKYNKQMEDMPVQNVLHLSGYDLAKIDAPFIKALQMAHDTSVIYDDFHERFEKLLKHLAKAFNLTYESDKGSEVDEAANNTGLFAAT